MTALRARCAACNRVRPLGELLPIDFAHGRRWYCRGRSDARFDRLRDSYAAADAALRQAATARQIDARVSTSRRDTR